MVIIIYKRNDSSKMNDLNNTTDYKKTLSLNPKHIDATMK